MTSIDFLRILYRYHFDTTLRLITAAQDLTGAQRTEPNKPYQRSVHDLLFHILQSDRGWRLGLQTGERPAPMPAEEYEDLASLEHALLQEQSEWSKLLAGMGDDQIGEEVLLQSRPGHAYTFSRWKVLFHVLLHGMQHQAEIADALTHAGHPPGDIDFIFYAWSGKNKDTR